jgi:hydroxymethylpyrimidine pyrophosphatase-like HAD family hydrolase
MEKKIWFDMDGTIADLYGDPDWLAKLIAYNPEPYEKAMPLLNMSLLARYLNKLQKQGYEICIVSWLSKNSTEAYEKAVAEAKIAWLKKHLASVRFNQVDIIPYGTPKNEGRQGILFDDELRNREQWGEGAYDVHNIIEILKGLQ